MLWHMSRNHFSDRGANIFAKVEFLTYFLGHYLPLETGSVHIWSWSPLNVSLFKCYRKRRFETMWQLSKKKTPYLGGFVRRCFYFWTSKKLGLRKWKSGSPKKVFLVSEKTGFSDVCQKIWESQFNQKDNEF